MADEATPNAPATSVEGGQQAPPSSSAPPQTPPTPAAPTGIGKEEIATIVREAVTAVVPPPQQPQMTQEQIDAALRVFRPTAKHVERLQAGGEEAVNALNEIVQGVYNQAVTMAQYQLQAQLQRVEEQLGPVQSYYREQALNTLKQEFFTENPDLKGLDPLLNSIHQEIVSEGITYKSKKEAFAEVAKRARNVIKSLPGVGQANNGQSQQQPLPPHQMSALTGGGQGGSSNTPASGGNPPRFAWQELG